MDIPCFQVDAFATRPFTGNPAAVCVLEGGFLPDALMQSIAFENALSETAFVVRRADGDFDLRWLTPEHEVDLCGHATLATAHVLARVMGETRPLLRFHTQSGVLGVEVGATSMTLDFPSRPPTPCEPPPGLFAALGVTSGETLRSRDLVVVLASSEEVRALKPDMGRLEAMKDLFAVCVTARGTGADADVDFVSRFFAPREGVPEDPVTGSAHCTLTPLWASRLGKNVLRARQVSRRGGELGCALVNERVRIEGSAVLVKTGTFTVTEPCG